jgi:lipopolysaccharide export system permease protein
VKKLDRYVLRELMVPFLIGTLSVLLMFQANTLIFQLKTFSLSAVPPLALAQLILFKTPYFLTWTLPIAMSLTSSLAMSRLAREAELTAMRGAGASILRVCMPVMFFGALVGVGLWYITERVMPPAQANARKLEIDLSVRGMAPEFRSNVVVNLRNFTASIGSVSRGKGSVVQLAQILLFERPRVGEVVLYTAETGEYRDGIWSLHNANAFHVKGTTLTSFEPGKAPVINDPISVESLFSPPSQEEYSADQLLKAIAEGKKTGQKTTGLEVAYHTRFAIPATCFIFAVIGPIFAVWFARAGGFVGVLLSIVIVFLYYNAHIISTEILGRNEIVAPWLAAWLPNVVFTAFGLLAIRRLE